MTTVFLGRRALMSLFGAAILASGMCSALALHAEFSANTQIPTTPVSFASPELDALAKKMAEEIGKKKIGSLVVVGGGGPELKVSELGAHLRDAFNDSLARQTQGARVLDGASLRDMLRKSRVSEGMLYTDVIADWIAAHASADAYVTFRVYALSGSRASLVTELFTKDKKGFQSIHREGGAVTLTGPQSAAADSDFQPTLNYPEAVPGSSNSIKCLVCLPPKVSDDVKPGKFSGTVDLDIVVRPDGAADDIVVVKPIGHGMDANAIDAVLRWKFQPGQDAQGQAIAMQVTIQVKFERY